MVQLTPIPAKLKAADLTRFINRAVQLESVKPVIAYWCEYWIVNQILSKGLHNEDPETLQFTNNLMDKLEKIKSDNPTDNAILDDTVGQAYVEQFALETFQRADKAVKANKATKQTASTFQAAATFLELVNIWSTPDNETISKIKYAKWNAVRIVRALNEGKDPNEINSGLEADDNSDTTTLDLNGVECHGSKEPVECPHVLIKNSEDLPSLHNLKVDNSKNSSLSDASTESCSKTEILRKVSLEESSHNLEVSLEKKIITPVKKHAKENLSDYTEYHDSKIIDTPLNNCSNMLQPSLPTQDIPQPSRNFESFPPLCLSDVDSVQSQELICQFPSHACVPQVELSVESHATVAPQPDPAVIETSDIELQNQLQTDDASIAEAQKHARWAISALNFEDTKTAVRELREALKILGAE